MIVNQFRRIIRGIIAYVATNDDHQCAKLHIYVAVKEDYSRRSSDFFFRCSGRKCTCVQGFLIGDIRLIYGTRRTDLHYIATLACGKSAIADRKGFVVKVSTVVVIISPLEQSNLITLGFPESKEARTWIGSAKALTVVFCVILLNSASGFRFIQCLDTIVAIVDQDVADLQLMWSDESSDD